MWEVKATVVFGKLGAVIPYWESGFNRSQEEHRGSVAQIYMLLFPRSLSCWYSPLKLNVFLSSYSTKGNTALKKAVDILHFEFFFFSFLNFVQSDFKWMQNALINGLHENCTIAMHCWLKTSMRNSLQKTSHEIPPIRSMNHIPQNKNICLKWR